MNVLNQSAFLKALGWSLLDSFWQVGILWLIYVILTSDGRRFQSRQRHSLALLSLMGGSAWFIISFVFHYQQVIKESVVVSVGSGSSFTSIFNILEPILPFLSVAYLSVLIYLSIRLYAQYRNTRFLFTSGTYKVNPELRAFLQQVASHMGIKKNVRIWLSELVDTPLTVGFWKPVILLPVAAINHLTIQQAESIILHELNHIRRNDYLINLLIACIDIILFFNPFIRILIDTIKKERENSCDDMVLQFKYDARQYVKALLLLEQNRTHTPTLSMAATGRSRKFLLQRVERMLNKQATATPINQRLVAYVLSALLIGFIGWYNPGKVIETTLEKVEETVLKTPEPEQISFTTPSIAAAESEADAPSRKIKSTPAKLIASQNLPEEEPVEYQYIREETPQQADETSMATLASFASATIAAAPAYTIPENTVTVAPSYSPDVHPYIPSTAFSYQVVEDTALPKKHILTATEVKAMEGLAQAMKALNELDWQKLEKELNASGKKVDIIKLQKEIKKAMAEVDFKKINDEMQSSLIQAENELLKEHSALRKELQEFQKDRSVKSESHNKLRATIVNDRLCEEKAQSQSIKSTYQKPQQKPVRKIVVI